MKKTLPIIILSLFLAACTHASPQGLGRTTPFTDAEVYEGYPCQDNCSDFKKGYDHAKEKELTTQESCSGETLEETTGCRAYVQDYTAAQQPDFYILN